MDTTVGILNPKDLNESSAPGEKQPAEPRKCSDCSCLVVFLFLNICLWTLSGWSYHVGDPLRLRRGWDLNGDFCGVGKLQDREYTYFPIPLQTTDVALCLPGCPSSSAEESICLYDEEGKDLEDEGCFNAYSSKPFFNKYCLPANRAERKRVTDELYSNDWTMTRVVGDLARAWDLLAIGGLIAGGAMTLFLLALHVPVMTIPLVAISVPLLLFLFAVICFLIYEESWRVDGKLCDPFGVVAMDQCDEGDIAEGYRDLCWVMISLVVVTSIVLCWMLITKLRNGLRVMKTLGRIHRLNPFIWLCPMLGIVMGVSFYAYFLTLLIYQVSCGDTSSVSVPILPSESATIWEFTPAERVLVFFDVGMIFWWLSLIAHLVEYVAGSMAWQWSENREIPAFTQFSKAIRTLVHCHLGSVVAAAITVPTGRLGRNLYLGLKSLFSLCHFEAKCCFWPYRNWFKFMTSDALAYHTVHGDSLRTSALEGQKLIQSHQAAINAGNAIIWFFQLVIIMISPVFVAYWILHESETFRSEPTKEVTSVTAMAIYVLVLSWFLAQVYGGFARGLLHGSILAFLANKQSDHPNDALSALFGSPGVVSPSEPQIQEVPKQVNAGVDMHDGKPLTHAEAPKDELVPPPSRGEPEVHQDLSHIVDETNTMIHPQDQ